MTEVWLKTYRSIGSFTFQAAQAGLHRFHVIGAGGNGANGGMGAGSGGTGGGSGGYGIHSVALAAGETVAIEISMEATKLTHEGRSVTATAGSGAVPGTCTGANGDNLAGSAGGEGSRGSSASEPAYSWRRVVGGNGGSGGNGVGKYQSAGGNGGNGGQASGNTLGSDAPYHARNGAVVENLDNKIGSAGGGGGNGASVYSSYANAGSGAVGQVGGVVVEFVSSAPTAPPWIDVGDRILAGKEVEVTWGTASDVNGDLAGYAMERSANGGAWQLVYKGSLRAFTDTAALDWQTVQYRVQAYDAEGSGSGYISTAKMTVIHNSPPQAPASIFVPDPIFGGTTVTVSWSRAADTDGNLAGYTLEQNTGDGVWTEVKNTTALSGDIPITFGWKSIQFRVRAYDAYGAVGPYVESNTITIINNRPPVISGEDRDLGTLTDSFPAQSYVVSDEDGDQVTVTIKLDEVVIESFTAELGKENILEIPADEWRKLLNGPHTIEILVDDQPPLGLRQVSVPYGHLPLQNLSGTFNSGCKTRWQRTRCRKNASSAPKVRSRRGVRCVLRFVITPTTPPRHGKTSHRRF